MNQGDIPINIMDLINTGKTRSEELITKRKKHFNQIVEEIKKEWDEVEKATKFLIPEEVREYFCVDKPETPKFSSYPDGVPSEKDIDDLRRLNPVSSIKDGVLRIPGIEPIDVAFGLDVNDNPYPIFRLLEFNENSQDGSLEIALYYARLKFALKKNINSFSHQVKVDGPPFDS
jgi:hypothetical protein